MSAAAVHLEADRVFRSEIKVPAVIGKADAPCFVTAYRQQQRLAVFVVGRRSAMAELAIAVVAVSAALPVADVDRRHFRSLRSIAVGNSHEDNCCVEAKAPPLVEYDGHDDLP